MMARSSEEFSIGDTTQEKLAQFKTNCSHALPIADVDCFSSLITAIDRIDEERDVQPGGRPIE